MSLSYGQICALGRQAYGWLEQMPSREHVVIEGRSISAREALARLTEMGVPECQTSSRQVPSRARDVADAAFIVDLHKALEASRPGTDWIGAGLAAGVGLALGLAISVAVDTVIPGWK